MADEVFACVEAGAVGDRLAVVFAAVGFADPGEDVERGEAGAEVVGIGAEIEELGCEFEMTVFDGDDEGGGAGAWLFVGDPFRGRGGLVDVDAGFEQRTNDGGVATAGGEEERCETGVDGFAEIGLSGDECGDDVSVAFVGGPHEGGLAAGGEFIVDAGAAGEEGLDGGEAAGARGGHERRLAAAEGEVGIGAGVEEESDEGGGAVGAGEGERGDAVAVLGVGIGLGREKRFRGGEVVVAHGPVEGGSAVGLRGVDGGVGEESADRGGVALFDGVGEGAAA